MSTPILLDDTLTEEELTDAAQAQRSAHLSDPNWLRPGCTYTPAEVTAQRAAHRSQYSGPTVSQASGMGMS